jgi:hypothetical protein
MSEQLYRLCVGNEDFGTAGEEVARVWLVIRERYPDYNVRIEPVGSAAPTFPLRCEHDDESKQ